MTIPTWDIQFFYPVYFDFLASSRFSSIIVIDMCYVEYELFSTGSVAHKSNRFLYNF